MTALRETNAALLRAIAIARIALLEAYSGFEDGPFGRARAAVELDRLRTENALLHEELRIKTCRLARIPARERPHYDPIERLAILKLRAAAGWNAAEAARRFLLTPLTIANWMRRLDEQGEHALVRPRTPVNQFPAFVEDLVQSLRCAIPTMGNVRTAQILARAGLRLSATTIARFAKRKRSPQDPKEAVTGARVRDRRVTANYPHHLWHVDLTVVPILGGLWIPWMPQSLAQRWPFAWWVAIVLDHYSRAVVGGAVFRKQPTAADVEAVLEKATVRAGRAPRYIVSDQGPQFGASYRRWCRRKRIRPRFGAIGRKGSIALIERFIRSMKDEHFRRIVVPLSDDDLRVGLDAYVEWYNDHRPHSALEGETPSERLQGRSPACDEPGFETRARHPRRGRRRVRGILEVEITSVAQQPHLPIVALRDAA